MRCSREQEVNGGQGGARGGTQAHLSQPIMPKFSLSSIRCLHCKGLACLFNGNMAYLGNTVHISRNRAASHEILFCPLLLLLLGTIRQVAGDALQTWRWLSWPAWPQGYSEVLGPQGRLLGGSWCSGTRPDDAVLFEPLRERHVALSAGRGQSLPWSWPPTRCPRARRSAGVSSSWARERLLQKQGLPCGLSRGPASPEPALG